MLKTPEEVAAEMVPVEGDLPRLMAGDTYAVLSSWDDADIARAEIAKVIIRSRTEGATAERERLAAHAGRPAEEVAAEMVRLDRSDWEIAMTDGVNPIRVDNNPDPAGEARHATELLVRLISRERAAAYTKGMADEIGRRAAEGAAHRAKVDACFDKILGEGRKDREDHEPTPSEQAVVDDLVSLAASACADGSSSDERATLAEVDLLRAELATSEERRVKWEALAADATNRLVGAAATVAQWRAASGCETPGELLARLGGDQ